MASVGGRKVTISPSSIMSGVWDSSIVVNGGLIEAVILEVVPVVILGVVLGVVLGVGGRGGR